MHRRRTAIVGLFLVFVMAIAPAATLIAPSSSNSNSQSSTTINVLAAASLTAAMSETAKAFSQDNPNIKVTLSFAGSSTLVTQITAGAPVDVVAMADLDNMRALESQKLVSTSSVQTMTKNRLAIITAAGNPLNIQTLNDLSDSRIALALCDISQPCGRYAVDMFARKGLSITPASRESSVTGVVSRVATGEADAGIAYVSDAVSKDGISAITIPDSDNIVAEYPIARASQPSSGSTVAAQAFIDFLMSDAGQSILTNFGFIRVKQQ